jgi:PPM family protein phosphatase
VGIDARTAMGAKRSNNEDSLLVARLDGSAPHFDVGNDESPLGDAPVVLVVADGMGGAAAGEIASRMAVEIIHERLATSGRITEERAREALTAAITEADERIRHDGQADLRKRGMGSTVTAMLLFGRRAVLGHVGDSRAYLLRRGEGLKQLTRDQTLAQQLADMGVLPLEAMKEYPHNVLSQVLGGERRVKPELVEIDLRDGDVLLLCSDGLNDALEDVEIRDVLSMSRDVHQAGSILAEAARKRGARDDCTFVIARVDGIGATLEDLPPTRPSRGNRRITPLTPSPVVPVGGNLAARVARSGLSARQGGGAEEIEAPRPSLRDAARSLGEVGRGTLTHDGPNMAAIAMLGLAMLFAAIGWLGFMLLR